MRGRERALWHLEARVTSLGVRQSPEVPLKESARSLGHLKGF